MKHQPKKYASTEIEHIVALFIDFIPERVNSGKSSAETYFMRFID